jgi:hypothetical protein
MGAPFFFHLSNGTYGTLAYGESVELGGIKLRRDITVFRKMPIAPSDSAQNLAFFIYLDHRLKNNTALNPEFLRINTN